MNELITILERLEDEALLLAGMYRRMIDLTANAQYPSLLDELESMQERFVKAVR